MEFKNIFTSGQVIDHDKAVSPEGTWLEAHNLTLSGDGKFFSLTNIKGTEQVGDTFLSPDSKVLKVIPNKYTIGTTQNVNCLTIFTSEIPEIGAGVFKIICYDLDNNTTYPLFEEIINDNTAVLTVDVVTYPENGLDIVYFTDNYHEVRRLRCEIPTGALPNFLTEEQLSLQRRGTLAKIYLNNILTTSGSLSVGSYQFVLRFYNQDTNTYSKWTIPSHPVNITKLSGTRAVGGYNVVANKTIQMGFDIRDEEVDLWTHFQFAVIENTSSTPLLNASLLKLETLTGGSTAGGFTTFTFNYDSNIKIGEVAIEDIVVDQAPIDKAKTIQIKNNRLFIGNIELKNLEYDREPTVSSGSVLTQDVTNTNDLHTSSYRGYFRDEVYRYYVSYFDEGYNFSRPKALDMSAVSNNRISSGIDMRFPTRKEAGFTILDTSNNVKYLGVSVTINNHPSWAKGFIILRAKRKKKIKFQTPFVPSCLVEGVEVIGSYPNTSRELNAGSSGTITTSYPDATPMNPVGTHMPKNMFFRSKRDFVRLDQDNNPTTSQKGEVKIQNPTTGETSDQLYIGFPPQTYSYGGDSLDYTFNNGDVFNTVDYAFTRLTGGSQYSPNTYEPNLGNYLQTSTSGTFFTPTYGDYYYSFSSTRPDPASTTKTGEIEDVQTIDTFGEGTSIKGLSIGEYSNLETGGVFYNSSPNNQKLSYFKLNSSKPDSAQYSFTSANGASVSSSLTETGESNQSNTFNTSKMLVLTSTIVNLVDIVNIETNLDDLRYGDPEDIHDMVYTGASHVFNTSELANVVATGNSPVSINVFGGDAYVSLHQFKLTDNHYGLINVEKVGAGVNLSELELCRRWERTYDNKWRNLLGFLDSKYQIGMPVPYKNVSQVLSVYLESEINGELVNHGAYTYSTVSGLNNLLLTTDEYKFRVPFNYEYNVGHSKESDQKAFIPFDDDEVVVTKYPARGYFSDQKVYGTDVEGFDVIKVASTFDLEETYDGITKLTLAGDNLFALQTSAIAWIPVDADNISTTDGSTLSIRSGEVTGIPVYISRQYGCQHIDSVKTIDDSSFFVDNINKVVIKLTGQQIDLISERGMIQYFSDNFTNSIGENEITTSYDPVRRQLWFIDRENQTCYIWDDRFGFWISNYEFDGRLYAAAQTKNNLFLIGKEESATTIHVWKMYTGEYNSLLGSTKTPRVVISINPDIDVPKTFDNVIVNSSAALDQADMITEEDSGLNQEVSGMVFASNREGNYRIATLRDGSNGRLRGLRAITTLKWPTDDVKISLASIITKYRHSYRPL